MKAVKVRGIYSSAITNLLSKNKFKVAQPSNNIKDSFPKLKFQDNYDTIIYDFSDKGGIIIKGNQAEKIAKLFEKKDNVFINKEYKGHIYLGKIIKLDPVTKNIHVDIGKEKVGILPLKDYWGFVKEGEKILVQLKNEEREHILLSTKIHLFGNDVVLIQKGFTKIANSIRDKKVIDKLKNISEESCKDDWGALWKISASHKNDKELREEIEELYIEFEKLKTKFDKEKKIQILNNGVITCYLRFSKETKTYMDSLRREIKPTITNHHRLKTDNFANIVDFSENLIKEKVSEAKINKTITKFVNSKSVRVGDIFLIVEYYAKGSPKYIKGKIMEKTDDTIKIQRFLKSGTTFNLLNIPIEKGDYTMITCKENEEFVYHELCSRDNEVKAIFYTLNTPTEVNSREVLINSMQLAVTKINDTVEILHDNYLTDLTKKGNIPEKMSKKAKKLAKKLEKESGKK